MYLALLASYCVTLCLRRHHPALCRRTQEARQPVAACTASNKTEPKASARDTRGAWGITGPPSVSRPQEAKIKRPSPWSTILLPVSSAATCDDDVIFGAHVYPSIMTFENTAQPILLSISSSFAKGEHLWICSAAKQTASAQGCAACPVPAEPKDSLPVLARPGGCGLVA